MGDQNKIGIFLKIGFETIKYHFCVLLALTVTVAILHPKFEKVIKSTQNVPKTVEHHQEQLAYACLILIPELD